MHLLIRVALASAALTTVFAGTALAQTPPAPAPAPATATPAPATAAPAPAYAAPAYPPPAYPPPAYPPPPPAERGVHLHDGLYLRLALGVSVLHDSFSARSSGLFFGDSDGTVTGFGQANEIAVGGAIIPGLIIAGAFVADIARTTKTDATGYPVNPGNSYVFATFGPLLDVYPDPEGGFHLQAGGGFGLTSGVQPQGASGGSGIGFGLFAGTGYEWWVASQWGLGALLRLQYVSTHESEPGLLILDSYDVDHRGIAGSLLFTATYN